MVLICPTFVHNKTYDGFVDGYLHIFVIDCLQEEIELWLKLSSHFFQGTSALVVLDDCAASNASISVWVLRSRSSTSQNHSAETWPPSFCKLAEQSFTNTDYAFKLYNRLHQDEPLTVPSEPKFSNLYKPISLQKQGELIFLGGGALALGYAAFRFL